MKFTLLENAAAHVSARFGRDLLPAEIHRLNRLWANGHRDVSVYDEFAPDPRAPSAVEPKPDPALHHPELAELLQLMNEVNTVPAPQAPAKLRRAAAIMRGLADKLESVAETTDAFLDVMMPSLRITDKYRGTALRREPLSDLERFRLEGREAELREAAAEGGLNVIGAREVFAELDQLRDELKQRDATILELAATRRGAQRCPKPATGNRTKPELRGQVLSFAPADDACTVCDHCGEDRHAHGRKGSQPLDLKRTGGRMHLKTSLEIYVANWDQEMGLYVLSPEVEPSRYQAGSTCEPSFADAEFCWDGRCPHGVFE